ncbi:MAG: 4-hydroxy-tetrahydrodipicolinate synthase [Bradymonadaceae bacterium]|nr:4-hydroxy-tetrahydrodipicolinate synthase [Lujinxingiaceae bacterium]
MARPSLVLEGALTALITPFADGGIDHPSLAALVDRQIAGGIDGLVPCGTTGESATMTEDERLAVISTVVEAGRGRVPVVAGTGSNDTRVTVAFTRKAAEIRGVDAALVVTPYYNKPNQEGLYRHFAQIADEGGLPVVVYNVPGRTAVSLTAQTVARLAAHGGIIAIKEATADMVLATRIVELAGEAITLLSGDDFTTLPLLSVGGRGCISVVSNLDPTSMSQMCHLANGGDYDSARALHMKIQPLARALFSDSNPVPVKTAAALLGWCGPELRGPLYAPDDASRASLAQVLAAYGLLKG